MATYLIDINLPYRFAIWHSDEFIHQRDLNPEAPDAEIWAYARQNALVIVTKDRDYSDRMLLSLPPPRVIHLRVGNMRLREFHRFMGQHWERITQLSKTYKLVYVFRDRLEGIA